MPRAARPARAVARGAGSAVATATCSTRSASALDDDLDTPGGARRDRRRGAAGDGVRAAAALLGVDLTRAASDADAHGVHVHRRGW